MEEQAETAFWQDPVEEGHSMEKREIEAIVREMLGTAAGSRETGSIQLTAVWCAHPCHLPWQ